MSKSLALWTGNDVLQVLTIQSAPPGARAQRDEAGETVQAIPGFL